MQIHYATARGASVTQYMSDVDKVTDFLKRLMRRGVEARVDNGDGEEIGRVWFEENKEPKAGWCYYIWRGGE